MTADFKDLGAELSNWGRWGADDQLGTLNLVGPHHVRAAAAEVASGKVFQLSIAVGKDGPQSGMGGRLNPVHLMSMQPQDWDPARAAGVRRLDHHAAAVGHPVGWLVARRL